MRSDEAPGGDSSFRSIYAGEHAIDDAAAMPLRYAAMPLRFHDAMPMPSLRYAIAAITPLMMASKACGAMARSASVRRAARSASVCARNARSARRQARKQRKPVRRRGAMRVYGAARCCFMRKRRSQTRKNHEPASRDSRESQAGRNVEDNVRHED